VGVAVWGVGSHRGGGGTLHPTAGTWMRLMCGVSMFPAVRLAAVVSPGRLLMRWRVGILGFARPCVMVVFVTPLAPRPASCRVVAAPRRCVASRAGI